MFISLLLAGLPEGYLVQGAFTVLQEWSSSNEDTSTSGLATHTILRSIPPHVLKALESQQNLANAVNAEIQVSRAGTAP